MLSHVAPWSAGACRSAWKAPIIDAAMRSQAQDRLMGRIAAERLRKVVSQ